MDDFLLYVESLVNGKDWWVYLQIPHSKWSKDIAEYLCYGGLWQVFQEHAESITVEKVMSPTNVLHKRPGGGTVKPLRGNHYTITIGGIRTKQGHLINDLLISVQLPVFKDEKTGPIVAEKMAEMGLGYYLGATVKRVYVKPCGETNPGALEPIITRPS